MDNGFTEKQKAAIIKAAQAYTSRLYAEFIAEKAEELLNPQPTLADRVLNELRLVANEEMPNRRDYSVDINLFKKHLAKALKAAGVVEQKDKYSIALEVFRDEYWPNRHKSSVGFEWWLKEKQKKGGE